MYKMVLRPLEPSRALPLKPYRMPWSAWISRTLHRLLALVQIISSARRELVATRINALIIVQEPCVGTTAVGSTGKPLQRALRCTAPSECVGNGKYPFCCPSHRFFYPLSPAIPICIFRLASNTRNQVDNRTIIQQSPRRPTMRTYPPASWTVLKFR
jgi:hypothetical protein